MHFRRLWNGMFDRHRVEITVMQFTGHSLRCIGLWLYCGVLTLSHIVSQAHPRQWNMQLRASLEWHVWPGQGSIYYNWTVLHLTVSKCLIELSVIHSIKAVAMSVLLYDSTNWMRTKHLEKARKKIRKDSSCCFKQMPEAASHINSYMDTSLPSYKPAK